MYTELMRKHWVTTQRVMINLMTILKMTENVKYQSISHSVRVYALFHEILATYLYCHKVGLFFLIVDHGQKVLKLRSTNVFIQCS